MNNLNELTAEIASNIFDDLTNEEILFLKFCNGFNLDPRLLRSIVTNDENESYQVKGFVWKYEYVNFKNNDNFLNNELLIHLKYHKEEKEENIQSSDSDKVTNKNLFISGGLTSAYAGSLSSLFTFPGLSTTSICSSEGSQILTKDYFLNVVDKKENEVIKNASSNDLYISLKEFCKKYKSWKFQINEIIQDKRLKIVIV